MRNRGIGELGRRVLGPAVTALAVLVPASPAIAVDGDLYTPFSGDGRLTTDFGAASDYDNPRAAILDSSGRQVIVGQADGEMAVARVSPDGTLDATFGGGDGKVILDSGPSASAEYAKAVAIDADGKIVVLGSAGPGGGSDLVLARLEANGDLDPSFDGPGAPGNGIFRFGFATYDDPAAIAIRSGKIIVGSVQTNTGPVPSITRLTAAGALDATYGGGDGNFSFSFPNGGGGSFLFDVAVQSDGMIVAAGTPNGGAGGVARIKEDGSGLDTTGFNPGGAVPGILLLAPPSGYFDFDGADIAIDASGGVVLGGYAQKFVSPNVLYDMGVARVTSGGGLDGGFGSSGYTIVTLANQGYGESIELQPDGAILLGGGAETSTPFEYDPSAARFLSTGALDTTFSPAGVAGVATPGFGQDSRAAAVLLAPSGVAYLVGPTTPPGGSPQIGVTALVTDTPAAPFVTAVSPSDTSDTLTPRVQGTAAEATTVALFTDAGCTGPPAATGTKAEFEGAGIEVAVAPGSQTTFWARAVTAFDSECSSVQGVNASRAYSVIPTPPTPSSTNPPSGSNDNSPRVIGTARADANTVELFTQPGCTGPVAGTGTGAAFTGAGIAVSVADGSTTTFYARALGTHGNSGCSASGVTYAEVTPPPADPIPPATPRKCKKGQKLKKGKCVKKRRKKK